MRISCYRCGGSGWVCETHPDKSCGHDRCEGAALSCPACAGPDAKEKTPTSLAVPRKRRPPARNEKTGQFSTESSVCNGFRDSFDYDTLWRLLQRIRQSHRVVRFADLTGHDQERLCILRHDVDYTLYSALTLARAEAARGIQATYFLLVNSAYYNLLSPSHAHVPAALTDLGHEVGLHYDVQFMHHFPRNKWEDLLDSQAALLERLSGQPVVSIAMHQPALNGCDPFRESSRYVNAYAPRFTEGMPYLSDSCRAWRDAAWRMLTDGPLPDRLQLGLHPINWAVEDRQRVSIFRDLHLDLATAVLTEGEDLLSKIQAHPAVIEHNARTGRS